MTSGFRFAPEAGSDCVFSTTYLTQRTVLQRRYSEISRTSSMRRSTSSSASRPISSDSGTRGKACAQLFLNGQT